MNDLAPVLVCAIIFITVYKIFELFVRRNERLAMIEKLSNGIDPQILKAHSTLPVYKNESYSSWAIRIGLLLLGLGLGVAIAVIVDLFAVPPATEGHIYIEFRNAVSLLYPAFASVFGGIGLVIAYFIERKGNKPGKSSDFES